MSRPLARSAQRVLALLAVGVLAVAIALAMHLDRPGRVPPSSATRMFPRLDLEDARTAGSLPTLESTAAYSIVVYVSDHCPHCTAELARWDSIISAGHGRFRNAPVTVIRAPGSVRTRHRAPFARRELVDARGDLARALRIDAVPASFVVAGDGTILNQRAGQTGPRNMQKFIAKAIQGGGP